MFSFDAAIFDVRVDRRNENAVYESELRQRLLAIDSDFIFDRRGTHRAAGATGRLVVTLSPFLIKRQPTRYIRRRNRRTGGCWFEKIPGHFALYAALIRVVPVYGANRPKFGTGPANGYSQIGIFTIPSQVKGELR